MTIIFDGTLGITTPTETANNSVTTPVVKSGSALTLQTNGSTTAVTIDTSQRVGIGQTSPTSGCLLDVKGGDVRIENTSSAVRTRYVAGSNQWNVEAGQSTNQFGIYDAAAGLLRMNIDTGGRVTMPYQPAVVAVSNRTQTISSGTQTKVNIFGGGGYSRGSMSWDDTNYRVTVPVAGLYMCMVKFCYDGNQSLSNDDSTHFRKNGTAFYGSSTLGYQPHNWTSYYPVFTLSMMMNCAANDYIEVWAAQYSGSDKGLNQSMGFFQVYLIS